MSTTPLHQDDRGEVFATGNELDIFDRTTGDPCSLGFHSNNETVGKLSIRQHINGAWREIGLITYEADERYRGGPPESKSLEVIFHTHIQGRGFDDPSPVDGKSDYRPMVGFRHDGIVLYGPNREETPIGGAVVPRTIALRSRANGHLVCAENAGNDPLIANRDAVGPWEMFDVIVVE